MNVEQRKAVERYRADLDLTEGQALRYAVLRDSGVGHSVALMVARRGNYNPYRKEA